MPWHVFWYLVFQLSACGISLERNVAPVWLTDLVPFLSHWEQKVWDQGRDSPVSERAAPWGQPRGVPWGTARLAGQCHTSGLREQGRAGSGVWGQSQPEDCSHSEPGGSWLWCSSDKYFQAEWGVFDKDPCSISSSQLWPRHGRWSEHRQPKLSEKERGPWPSRYPQSLASVLPNLKEELNAATRLPATPGGLDTCQCHQQGTLEMPCLCEVTLRLPLPLDALFALGFAPCHSVHPSASTDISTASTHHFLLQR